MPLLRLPTSPSESRSEEGLRFARRPDHSALRIRGAFFVGAKLRFIGWGPTTSLQRVGTHSLPVIVVALTVLEREEELAPNDCTSPDEDQAADVVGMSNAIVRNCISLKRRIPVPQRPSVANTSANTVVERPGITVENACPLILGERRDDVHGLANGRGDNVEVEVMIALPFPARSKH